MKELFESVTKFMLRFNQQIQENPYLDNEEVNKLRISLLREEVEELADAIAERSRVKVLDALCDIMYVLVGAILALGYAKVFPKAFVEVQRSNMSKSCVDLQEAIGTVETREEEFDTPCIALPNEDGSYNVYRKDNKKLLKSINYSPANLDQFI